MVSKIKYNFVKLHNKAEILDLTNKNKARIFFLHTTLQQKMLYGREKIFKSGK